MEPYSLICKKRIEKDLRKIPNDIISDIFRHIKHLVKEPVPHDSNELSGSVNVNRIRVGMDEGSKVRDFRNMFEEKFTRE